LFERIGNGNRFSFRWQLIKFSRAGSGVRGFPAARLGIDSRKYFEDRTAEGGCPDMALEDI